MALNHRGIGLALGFNIVFLFLLYGGFKSGLHGVLALVLVALYLSFNAYILYESYNYLQDCDEHTLLPIVAFGMSAVLFIVIIVVGIMVIAAGSKGSK